MRLVVDASVGVKWFVPEPLSDRALAILEDFGDGRVELYAPRVFTLEVASALRKYCVRGLVERGLVAESLRVLRDIDIAYVEVGWDLVDEALSYSLEKGVTVYDAVYIVTARKLKARLVTADERLYRALRSKEPALLFLGDYRRAPQACEPDR